MNTKIANVNWSEMHFMDFLVKSQLLRIMNRNGTTKALKMADYWSEMTGKGLLYDKVGMLHRPEFHESFLVLGTKYPFARGSQIDSVIEPREFRVRTMTDDVLFRVTPYFASEYRCMHSVPVFGFGKGSLLTPPEGDVAREVLIDLAYDISQDIECQEESQ